MTPQEFSERYGAQWAKLETLLTSKLDNHGELPALYREICSHLALARDRHYPLALVERLNNLVLAGQQRLYLQKTGLKHDIIAFVARGFPRLVRQYAGWFSIVGLLFYGPLFLTAAAIWHWPDLVYHILPAEQVAGYEQMYSPARTWLGNSRGDSQFMMFGYYVQHNTSIGFQTFAGGFFAGIGSLFFLLYNAILIGAVGGHLTHAGYVTTFMSFVITHSAFELTAVVISSLAGLLLGLAIIAPQQYRRRDAIMYRGKDAIQLMYGAASFFFIAALIESFWSASTFISPEIKYVVGASAWLVVILYLTLAGRQHAS